MFDVNISVEKNKVLGEFIADSYFFEPSKYDYAFYLYKDEERIETKWYTDNMKAEFLIDDFDGVFYIKAFVRDKIYGDKRTFDSEKKTIDS
ncbi:hypothetical protein [Psychrobacter sp. TWP2-1-2]|uniref:hypothetical protein n=1 Tax=Psychrobacter sp. TWP2-1-2 TaxID=2804623 RepID=UPI003CF198DD